jgi:NADPH:quinone reductase-like Zn-dependent oxidoreductase
MLLSSHDISSLLTYTYPHEEQERRLRQRRIVLILQVSSISLIRPTAQLLRQVAQLVDADDLRVPSERAYPLEQAVEALRKSEYGHVRGKIVLAID